MIGTWTVIVAFLPVVARSAGAGTSPHVTKSSPVLRGRRIMDEAVFCNSIGCPASFTPIDEAWNVECAGSVCDEDQCCLALCAGFACPSGQIPIEEVKYDVCVDNQCTEEQCCDEPNANEDGDEEYNDCSSVSCPSDTHRAIDNAESTRCLVIDDFVPFPPQFSDDDAFAGGSFSFYYDDDYSDITSDDPYFFTFEEPYSYEFEYCDVDTCCIELEYGLWGLE